MSRTGVRHRIYGVDFSGSETACKKIWISEAVSEDKSLRVLSSCPLKDIVPGKNRDRDTCLAALRSLISGNADAVFGMDFPFSLPQELLFTGDWTSFVAGFARRYPSPEIFRSEMRRNSPLQKELKRRTDTEVRAPFCVYNLRLYRQTYYGIRDVLLPLLMEDSARMIPMQEPVEGKPWLMEICPASTLKSEGLYIPYKGRSAREKESREYILKMMEERGVIVTSTIRDLLISNPGGDALDSMLAAFAAARAVPGLEEKMGSLPPAYYLEGYTFF
ncbi:MAG: DUF429 domain-containing protein [Methanosarcinaceae archaeon]|nr:DUF429 domain-containing protein [Methanosarcinaceae archaeon]